MTRNYIQFITSCPKTRKWFKFTKNRNTKAVQICLVFYLQRTLQHSKKSAAKNLKSCRKNLVDKAYLQNTCIDGVFTTVRLKGLLHEH